MQRGILIVPICASIAVNLECAEIGNELCEMLRALALDVISSRGQVSQLLRAEPPGSNRSCKVPRDRCVVPWP